jgi:folate-binding protein YgfZ
VPFAAWITRDAIHVDGPDTIAFLQGQLSQDVEAIGIGGARWSLLLQPNGKTVAWLRATRVGEQEVVLDGDAGSGAAVLARLERFKLRTKATLEPMFSMRCLAVRGVAAASGPAALPIAWPGVDGYDQLGDSASPRPGIELGDEQAYEAARIDAGVPAFGRELTEDTIPVELGQWLIDASVSFTKGCYTGQELVARIDSRGGHGPRPVRRLVIDGPARAGDAVTADERVIGTLTSAAWSDDRSVTLALAPLPRAAEGALRVGAATATIAA